MNEKNKAGRTELPVEEKMITITFRGKPSHKDKLELLGGGKFLRRKIEKEKVK